jgi:lipoprotein-releasing system permease protein
LFVYDDKQSYLSEGVDQLSKVNAIKKHFITDNGLNLINQVVVGYGIAQKFSLGLLDNKLKF